MIDLKYDMNLDLLNRFLTVLYSDVTIKVPSSDTAEIQEYHLPVYHCLCSMIEYELFN